MAYEQPVLVVFHGNAGQGVAERAVAGVRVAAVTATAEAALGGGFEAVIVATDDPEAFPTVPGPVVFDVDRHGEAFSYAERLRGIVRQYGLAKPAVIGSGALPLLREAEFGFVAEQLNQRDGRFVTNNFFSADLTGWTPGDAIEGVSKFDRDNVLPRRLRDEAGLVPVVMPRTTATLFDIDTPADLTVLALSEATPPAIRGAMEELVLPVERFRAVMPLLCDRTAEILVAGRIGSQTWQHLERETACRVRILSEERGLAAAGIEHRPVSLLGFLYEELGADRLMERLCETADAVLLDLRVLLAHLGVEASREDRFQADCFNWEAIANPTLAGLTKAAGEAPRPVLLGGHTLVAGGLMALTDVAWLENDRRLGI
ncbi:MAG: hypothetical protein KC482_00955 [Dehalococcoidia bacterium]|nr:hypothetical protein [Dehalococcoidia bacterium]MCA9844027.1 hypothetical protein [Dehalococcoidia bacterium]MCA9852166.1 hypothetical protein [Dehalococcoidia bacterium]